MKSGYCQRMSCVSLVLAFVGLMIAAPLPAVSAAEPKAAVQAVVIVQKDVKVETIKQKDLASIYLGKTVDWKDKSGIVFVTLKKGDTHKAFLKGYVKKTDKQFSTYWKKKMFSGKCELPKAFKTDKELVAFVAKTKGAIGYISPKSVAALEGKTVKKLTVK